MKKPVFLAIYSIYSCKQELQSIKPAQIKKNNRVNITKWNWGKFSGNGQKYRDIGNRIDNS